MARFSRLDTLGAVIASGLMPLFHHDDASTARRIAGALEEGGARVIEFTNRGEMALKVFSLLSEDFASRKSSLILGAGSVVGSWIGGRLTDRIGHYDVMVGTLTASGIAFILLQFVKGFLPFCAGIFLAFVATFLIELVSASLAFQLLVSVAGIVTMTAVAHYRTWIRSIGSSSSARSWRTV
jgi:MFS family permease